MKTQHELFQVLPLDSLLEDIRTGGDRGCSRALSLPERF
jgi:hypothetical protein